MPLTEPLYSIQKAENRRLERREEIFQSLKIGDLQMSLLTALKKRGSRGTGSIVFVTKHIAYMAGQRADEKTFVRFVTNKYTVVPAHSRIPQTSVHLPYKCLLYNQYLCSYVDTIHNASTRSGGKGH